MDINVPGGDIESACRVTAYFRVRQRVVYEYRPARVVNRVEINSV
jgi:hypothetical protein